MAECDKQMEKSPLNPHWKRTYADLGHAANILDAHLGRSEETVLCEETGE